MSTTTLPSVPDLDVATLDQFAAYAAENPNDALIRSRARRLQRGDRTPAATPTMRRRVEMQGFTGLDDETLTAVEPWLRLAPALCAAWAGLGTALGSAWILGALIPFAALGAVLRNHPFDAIYAYGIRRWTSGPSLPRYRAPRRFACGVATVWLLAATVALGTGHFVLGTILGAALVLAALVPTLTGFCIPSYVFGLLFGFPPSCRRNPGPTASSVLPPLS